LTYPSTRSLTPVNLPIDIQVEELYSDNPEILKGQNQEEEKELILSLENQRLNLQTAIEDNILLSIPTQVLTPQEQADKIMPHGQQWSVISEDQYQQKQKQTLNPQWDKLKDFIPKDKQ
ncbi:DUF177 domain-containing protein, partial [Lactobacillus sp. XV13L]|nr:DUF177 domain-containing protein [Lactobacillus sp. XV13L]